MESFLQYVGGVVLVKYSLVFAKNTSASRYFAGALTKSSAHGGILGKDGGVIVLFKSFRVSIRQDL